MEQTPASVLTPEVAAEIPNMPNPVIERHVALSVRALCSESPVWQETLPVTADGATIDLDTIDTDGEVVRLMPRGLSQGGQQLPVFVRPTGAKLGYYVMSRRHLRLTQTPDSDTFLATVQLRPAADGQTVPADVLDDYRDAIVSGALYRAYRMVNEPWASPDAAQTHYEMFQAGVRQSLTDVRRTPTEVS